MMVFRVTRRPWKSGSLAQNLGACVVPGFHPDAVHELLDLAMKTALGLISCLVSGSNFHTAVIDGAPRDRAKPEVSARATWHFGITFDDAAACGVPACDLLGVDLYLLASR